MRFDTDQSYGRFRRRHAGQDYFSYIRDYVFTPAGMTGSDPWGTRDAPGENIATGYTNQNPHDPGVSRSVLGYAGGAMGVNTALILNLQNGFENIVLSNYDMPVAMDVAQVITRMLRPS